MPRGQGRGRGRGRGRGGRPLRNIPPPARFMEEEEEYVQPVNVQQRNDDQILNFLREIRQEQDAINARLAILPVAPVLPAPALPAPVLPAPAVPIAAPALAPARALLAPPPLPQALPAPALPVPAEAVNHVALAAIPVPEPPRVSRTTAAYNELPRFDGTTYYETYEKQFRGVMAHYPDLTPADKALLLMRCLQGKALRVLDSLQEQDPQYEDISAALFDRFPRKRKQTALLLQDFYELKQTQADSLEAWRDKVVIAAWDAFGKRNEEVSIRKFINDLLSPMLRVQLMGTKWTTLDAAYDQAVAYQSALGTELIQLGI